MLKQFRATVPFFSQMVYTILPFDHFVVAVLTVHMGTKQRLSLFLVAKDRENPVVGAKNAGRWSR